VAHNDEDTDEDFNTYSNGYSRDGFVVGDDDDFDDDFESMPPPVARRRKMDSIGPPISRDARMSDENLTEIHKDVLESFFKEAQKLEERIRASKGIRTPIFSQHQLREMGLRWTVTVGQMRRIPGIDGDKVDRHGDKFLPLVQQYHQQYQEIVGLSPEPSTVPRFPGEIVDLVSTDDEDMDAIEDDDDDDEGEDEEGERSGYFEPSAEAKAFMQRLQRNDQLEAPSKPRERTSGASVGTRGKSNWRGGKKQSAPRRSSGGKFAGVKKKGATAKRTVSGQASRGGSGASSQGRTSTARNKSSRAAGIGFNGIGLMDH
jgi:bloom syndrome protein